MPSSVTPSALLLRQIDEFCGKLPGVRDGLTEAIHDTRVATRRLRELLPLVGDQLSPADTEQLDDVLRRATRRLGRARDVEVKLELLAALEPAVPVSAGEMGRLRLSWREERDRLVRRAIKTLERLELESTLTDLRQHLRAGRRSFIGVRRSAGFRWSDVLVVRLKERAETVAEAIGYAGGVLFPQRLHAARVALKKFRYAMEIATATGLVNFERHLRPIRKSQDLLGRIHDHDVLSESLRNARLGAQRLLPLIELHRQRLHERYLRRRDALLDACEYARGVTIHDRAAIARQTLVAASVPLAIAALPFVRRVRTG